MMLANSFQEILNQLQQIHSPELTALRKRALAPTAFLPIAFISLSFPILLTFILLSHRLNVIYPAFILFAALLFIPVIALIIKRTRSLNLYFKDKVIPDFAGLIHKNLTYEPTVSEDTANNIIELYNYTGYTEKIANKVFAKDHFSVATNDRIIELCNINLQQRISNGEKTSTSKLFRGLFMRAELTHEICDSFIQIILKNNKAADFNDAFEVNTDADCKSVDCESDGYESADRKSADCKSDELITAQLLTPNIKKMLLDFAHTHSIKFDIFIEDKYMLIRFHTNPSLSLNLSDSPLNDSTLYLYHSIFNLIMTLTARAISITT